MEVVVMITAVARYDIVKTWATDEFQDADVVAGSIENPTAMHEVFVSCDQVKEPSLLFWAAKTGHLDPGDHGFKFFVKDQLEDSGGAGGQLDGPTNPELGLIIQTKATLLFTAFHPVRDIVKKHHIVVLNLEEITGVGDDIEVGRNPVRSTMSGDELTNVLFMQGFGRLYHHHHNPPEVVLCVNRCAITRDGGARTFYFLYVIMVAPDCRNGKFLRCFYMEKQEKWTYGLYTVKGDDGAYLDFYRDCRIGRPVFFFDPVVS